jgi:hypothetical protein
MSKSGIPVYADTAALSRLSKSLRAASKVAWKAYKVGAAAGAEVVLKDAQGRTSYSKRIPQSGRVRVTAAGNPEVVFTAPNAAPIENAGKGFVRHPTYGHRDRFTDKNSHPAFAAPALAAHQEEVVAAVEVAITEAIRRVL